VIHPVSGHECHVIVTILADIAGLDMGRVFARGVRAVMTAESIVDIVRVIEIGGYPAHRRMAVIAIVAAINVCRILACGNCAVVTGTARADHLRMVHPICRHERHIVMAVLANAARLDVRGILAGSIDAVVAAEAVIGNVRVIESGRYPACGCVTVIAGVATDNMCRVLACGNRAVVAGVAGTDHVGVIYPVHRCEGRNIVAVLTKISGLNMRRSLAGRVRTIVAAQAVIGDIDMVNVGGNPARRRMAVIAGVAATNMGRVLAFGDRTVVAGVAGTQHLGVVNPVCRREELTVMTVFTNVGRLDV